MEVGMNCYICGAPAQSLDTNFHGKSANCAECGSYVISNDVLKEMIAGSRTFAVDATRLWLHTQRLTDRPVPVIKNGNVLWER
jgi:hypothetical protein